MLVSSGEFSEFLRLSFDGCHGWFDESDESRRFPILQSGLSFWVLPDVKAKEIKSRLLATVIECMSDPSFGGFQS